MYHHSLCFNFFFVCMTMFFVYFAIAPWEWDWVYHGELFSLFFVFVLYPRCLESRGLEAYTKNSWNDHRDPDHREQLTYIIIIVNAYEVVTRIHRWRWSVISDLYAKLANGVRITRPNRTVSEPIKCDPAKPENPSLYIWLNWATGMKKTSVIAHAMTS
jgi:hypothetical protein